MTAEPAAETAAPAPAETAAPAATPVPAPAGNRVMISLTKENFRDYFNVDCKCNYKDGKVTFRYAVSPVNGTFDAAEDTVTLEIRLHQYSSLNYAESEIGSRIISIPLKKELGYCSEGTEEFTLEEAIKSFFWDWAVERILIDGNEPAEGAVPVTAETAAPQAAPVSAQPKEPVRADLSWENFRDYFNVDCKLDYKEGKVTFRYAVSPVDQAFAEAEGAADTVTLEIRLYLYSSLNYAESEIDSILVNISLDKEQQYTCEGTEEFTLEEVYKSIFWDKKIEAADGWLMV